MQRIKLEWDYRLLKQDVLYIETLRYVLRHHQLGETFDLLLHHDLLHPLKSNTEKLVKNI